MNNACETAVVRRHVALCCGWARAVEKSGIGKVLATVDVGVDARFQLAEFVNDTPRIAAAVRAKGVG